MRKKKKTYASVMKKTGNIRYSQKGRRAGKIALPPQVMRVGMPEPAGCALGAFHVLYIWRHLSD